MRNTKVFLRDTNMMKKVVDSAEISISDTIIEIGSGDGRLTRLIAEKAAKVYAIEMDTALLDRSKVLLSDLKNVEFVNGDALEVPFPDKTNKVVSNLPYAISSPITEKIVRFLNGKKGSIAVLMYQREFGDRMITSPGFRDYSMLTVFTRYTCDAEKVVDVPRGCFKPTPAVDSVVIKLKPKGIKIDDNFLALCRVLFQHKKKNLYSAVLDGRENFLVKSKEELRERLSHLDEPLLKEKVFYLELKQLLYIYKALVNLSLWLESE